jgi:hypothetical protein
MSGTQTQTSALPYQSEPLTLPLSSALPLEFVLSEPLSSALPLEFVLSEPLSSALPLEFVLSEPPSVLLLDHPCWLCQSSLWDRSPAVHS